MDPNIPTEVAGAIVRAQHGNGTDQDRQIITTYLVQHSYELDDATFQMLGDLVDSIGSSSTGGGTIADQMAQSQQNQQATATPPPIQPPITGSTINIPSSPMDPMLTGQQGTSPVLQQPAMASVSAGLGGADMARGGIPSAVALSQRLPRDLRAEDPSRRAARGGTDWKTVHAMGPDSAFADVNPEFLQAYAGDPAMASREMYGKGIVGQAMAPQVQGAGMLSSLGLLGGGGHTKGIGGPRGDIARLAQTEQFLQNLGPGEYVDPTSVYRQTFRKLRKTPTEHFFSQSVGGEPGDVSNQIAATNAALIEPLKVYGSQSDVDGLAALLDRASQDYLDGLAHGTVDVTMSYPEWLRQQRKAQKFMG